MKWQNYPLTLQLLHRKHPASKNTDDEVLMSGEKLYLYPVIYERLMKT